MAADDVPLPEMSHFRAAPDPVDAVLRGEPADDPALEALVRDLREAYLPDAPRARSAALLAFAGPASAAGDPALTPAGPAPVASLPRGRRARVAIAAFAATLAGKVVLGGAVAAATVGGLHAVEVVDVPLLPDVDRRPPVTDPAPDPLELPPVDAEGSDADLTPDPPDGAGPAGTDAPATAPAPDGAEDDRPGVGPDAAPEGSEAPESTTSPGDPPPVPSTRPAPPGDGPGGTPPSTAVADAAPPTSATRSQSSRNIP